MTLAATVAMALLVGLIVFALTSAAVSLGWPLLGRWLAGAHPLDRARAALAVGVAPLALPAVVMAVCLAPGLVDLLGGPGDHCPTHADHVHLCLAHPAFAPSAGVALALGLACLGLAVLTRRPLREWRRASRTSRLLHRTPSRDVAPDAHEIDSERPFCFTSGFLRPSIWLSRGLWQALSVDQRAAVLAHERAHVRRRDPLARAAASLASVLVHPRVRRDILDHLLRASERLCDEAAAVAVGDRVLVAESLLVVERLCAGTFDRADAATHAAFGGSSLPERISQLLEPGAMASPVLHGWRAAALFVCTAFALEMLPVHHWVEHALEILPQLR